jgi:hypothetical protein
MKPRENVGGEVRDALFLRGGRKCILLEGSIPARPSDKDRKWVKTLGW